MANEIVKYHTELNTIPLRKFKPVEMNLFFSIVSRMRDLGDKTVRFSFEQLKELSDYKATANNRFIDDIYSTYEKILSLRFGNRSSNGLNRNMFVMFTQFEIIGDVEDPYVDIKIFEKAIPLLNGLDEWVRYSLQQFNELQSSYSKTMFRLLKQFRTTGYAYFSKNDLTELLDIPKSYRQSDINKNILKPIKEELTPLFRGLTIKKKYGKGRGNPVIGYQFTFKAERKDADDFSKGQHEDTRKKLFNVEHNSALSEQEKNRAKDKLMNFKVGTHEEELKKQQEKERYEREKEKMRAEILADLRNNF